MASTSVAHVISIKAMTKAEDNSVRILFRLERDEDGYPPSEWERLWAKKLPDGSYEIDNLPFYVRDISLGDKVSAIEHGGELHFEKLLLPSRNSIVRVFVKSPEQVELTRQELRKMGVESEVSDLPRMFAALLPPNVDVHKILEFLDERTESQEISFEESAVRYQQPIM
jgi:hypothetical protein